MLEERDPATFSPVEAMLAAVPVALRDQAKLAWSESCTENERINVFPFSWEAMWARPSQLPPAETALWDTWVIRAGRGFGKTRTGAEAVRHRVNLGLARAVTLVGTTAADARDVMIEGPHSGLLAVHPPDFRPLYEPSKRLLTWPNGAVGHIRSAEDPDSIRGLQSDLVWFDEPASMRFGPESWDMAMLGNRIGNPKSIMTGTPRPVQWLRDLEAQPTTVVTTGSTYENLGNLAPQFIRLILERYEGTRLGQQELRALFLDDVEGALWVLRHIEGGRFPRWSTTDPWKLLLELVTLESRLALGLGAWRPQVGERRRWVTWVGVDPPGETAECGIIVGTAPKDGRAGFDHCVIVDDMTVAGPPEVWGAQVIEAVRKHNADGVIVESNQGGDMVRAVIHAVDPNVHVEKVRAKVSKADRAEPVSALYGRGWVHHVGHLARLETQQTAWVPGDSKSPDRLDALVHLVTKLLAPQQPGAGRASLHSPVKGGGGLGGRRPVTPTR